MVVVAGWGMGGVPEMGEPINVTTSLLPSMDRHRCTETSLVSGLSWENLKAENIFPLVSYIYTRTDHAFVNILQSLTFEYLFIAYNEYGVVVQVSGGKSGEFLLAKKQNFIFRRFNSVLNILAKEDSVTLPVFIQPEGFSTSVHMLVPIQLKN